jgi:hypothetical protein
MALISTQQNSNGAYNTGERFATTSPTIYLDPSSPALNGTSLPSSFPQNITFVPYWEDQPDQYDTLTLIDVNQNQYFYGGKVVIEVEKEIMIQKPAPRRAGSDGYAIVTKGIDNAKVKLKFECWTPDQYKCWQSMISNIWALETNTRTTTGVQGVQQRNCVWAQHPILQAYGITQIFITKFGPFKQKDIGIYTFEFDALEWKAPSNSNNSSRAQSTPGNQTPPTVVSYQAPTNQQSSP